MSIPPVIQVSPLGFPWQCQDPFLFTVHHEDDYPAGNGQLGPQGSLEGRPLGQDFDPEADWRMYHGAVVPGFPSHPHRGFETVTVVRKGLADHFDSLGATSRFGHGDTQWMTAGSGVQHAEMFPLVNTDRGNPLELFQIWLNLPAASKQVAPYYTMLWAEDLPKLTQKDSLGRVTEVEVVAGSIAGVLPLAPPPDSWAADPENGVAIWVIRMEAGAVWTLPAGISRLNRTLFYYQGLTIDLEGNRISVGNSIRVVPDREARITNGDSESFLLLLQGKPIGEPVVASGPFVMNSEAEIQQAYADFRRTRFGGWPWPANDPVHPRERGRFARYPDGTEEVR